VRGICGGVARSFTGVAARSTTRATGGTEGLAARVLAARSAARTAARRDMIATARSPRSGLRLAALVWAIDRGALSGLGSRGLPIGFPVRARHP
jgi:hypothetical protein